jgi:hypothetical protein
LLLIPRDFHHNFPEFQFPKTAILDIDGKTEKVRPRAGLFPFLPAKIVRIGRGLDIRRVSHL